MFCLECMYKHSRDLEHHAEDALRVTSGEEHEFFERLVNTVREFRKEIFNKMVERASGGQAVACGCEGVVEPGQNPNPELAVIEEACVWEKEEVMPKERFDPRSFRTLCPQCFGQRCAMCLPEQICSPRIIIGCPAGYWDEGKKLCTISTRVHVVYRGRPR